MNKLVVSHGNQRAVLQPGQVGYVGRRDDSAVVVTDPRVSREHVRLTHGAHGWVLENVGRSGTFVFGQPVTEYTLGQPVEARLAVPDGPLVRFEPAPVSDDAPALPAAPAATA
ncbi:MAG TPA: FHA domain-containing protein, partial [Streptosporangiaceae bacterium]